MPDFDAITVALAARFAPGLVTPPTGYDNIRVSTGNLPGQMVPLPAMLWYVEGGEFTHFAGKRDSTHELVGRFYYNQTGDLERDMVALRRWLTILVNQLQGSVQLGGIVTSAHVASYAVNVFPYAGLDYTGIELRVAVNVNEAWSAVA